MIQVQIGQVIGGQTAADIAAHAARAMKEIFPESAVGQWTVNVTQSKSHDRCDVEIDGRSCASGIDQPTLSLVEAALNGTLRLFGYDPIESPGRAHNVRVYGVKRSSNA